MSFLRKRKDDDKLKKFRKDSTLDIHDQLEKRSKFEGEQVIRPSFSGKTEIDIKAKITQLEKQIHTPEVRRQPQNHISIIRRLAKLYLKAGDSGEKAYYLKAENLYKQFNVLYPLHMERDDWIEWITASAKARLIDGARKLLNEARLLYPGDEKFDEVETIALQIAQKMDVQD